LIDIVVYSKTASLHRPDKFSGSSAGCRSEFVCLLFHSNAVEDLLFLTV